MWKENEVNIWNCVKTIVLKIIKTIRNATDTKEQKSDYKR